MIRYSSLRGKWEDDLSYDFKNLDKPTSFKGNVIFMDIWEEGIVSERRIVYYYGIVYVEWGKQDEPHTLVLLLV